ncbi:MAG TPA: glycosyltransferase, partial [Cyclobacteriaceae bacterium]|nr:glycosyltransferase [Cyclobacteriaceae bacterium]
MDKVVTSTHPAIVMLANAGHKPFDTRIFHKEARSLHAAGWKVTIIIPHSENFEKEGVHFISVPLPKKGWEQLVRCPWNILNKSLQQPAHSIFHLHDSELLLVGIVLKIFGRKVIYDAHEDTPLQISYQHWIPWLVKKPYTWLYFLLEKLAGWWFNRIIVAEPVIAKYFPSDKVTLIRNFPIAQSFSEPVDYPGRSNTMVYVGLLSKPRG